MTKQDNKIIGWKVYSPGEVFRYFKKGKRKPTLNEMINRVEELKR